MNISQGDTSLIVRYIQTFLQEYYTETMRVSGIYDEYTHENLIIYLSKPNISDSYKVAQDMMDEFPELRTLFNMFFTPDTVQFISKTKAQPVKDFLQKEDTYNAISKSAQQHGWVLDKYIASGNNNTEKYEVVLGTNGKENIVPNRDLLPMINLFNNKYLMNLSIYNDGAGGGDLEELQTGINDDRTKLSYIEIEPNSKYTIYHGYPDYVQLTVGCYSGSPTNAQGGDAIDNVHSLYLAPGETYVYETPEETNILFIEMPWARDVEGILYSDMTLKLGDFNLDGNITQQDVDDLTEMLEQKAILIDPTASAQAKKEAKAKLDSYKPMCFYTVNFTNKVEHPTYEDIVEADRDLLQQYINREISSLEQDQYGTPVWTRVYTQEIDNNKVKYSNVIGITKGEYNDVVIPTKDFVTEHWAIHDKFIDYITLMAITPYSAEYDIRTIQKKLDKLLPLRSCTYDVTAKEYPLLLDKDGLPFTDRGPDGIYTEKLKELIVAFQEDRGIYFQTGYVNKDTESAIDQEYEIAKNFI